MLGDENSVQRFNNAIAGTYLAKVFEAVRDERADKIYQLCDRIRPHGKRIAIVNAINESRETLLHWAIINGCNKERVINALLENDADPNTVDENGFTPLHTAVEERLYDVVELLLRHNADPTIANKRGETPLDWAQDSEHQGIIKLLEEAMPNEESSPAEQSAPTRI